MTNERKRQAEEAAKKAHAMIGDQLALKWEYVACWLEGVQWADTTRCEDGEIGHLPKDWLSLAKRNVELVQLLERAKPFVEALEGSAWKDSRPWLSDYEKLGGGK